MKIVRLLMIPIACTLILSGCTSTKLQTKSFISNSIFIQPSEQNRSVYLNLKGASKNFVAQLVAKLRLKGYEITQNQSRAAYVLNAQILPIEKSRSDHAAAGASIGASTGLGISAYNHASGTGIVASGLLAAAAGVIVGKLTENVSYVLCANVQLDEQASARGFLTHSSKICAQASKMNLQPTEAQPVLDQQLSNLLADLF